MSSVTEPEKKVPVIDDVDVAVAGGGVAGTFAAIAAARNGASTLLIERFASIGGNIGPGMIVSGGMIDTPFHEKLSYESTIYPRLYGIAREFLLRYVDLGGGSIPPFRDKGAQVSREQNYARDSNIASYLAAQMLEESGAQLLVSTQVADPILEENCVRGLFVENKSGRQAVKAKVVIDATGEADVARRAGAPILYPKDCYQEIDEHAPTGMGLGYLVGGVNWEKYDAYRERAEISAEDLEWGREVFPEGYWYEEYRPIIPFVRKGVETGEYKLRESITLDGRSIDLGNIPGYGPMPFRCPSMPGFALGRIMLVRGMDAGNGLHISALEIAFRRRIFEITHFWKNYVPGFEDSFLLYIAPYLGSRGGPCIEGEYTLTMDDCRAGRRFDDVLYLYGENRALRHSCSEGECKWVDMPYRVMLPKKIDGLLAVGRSASGIPDTLLRHRMAAKVMGQAVGTAAALAAKQDISPKKIDVTELQGILLDAGYYLGDRWRLKELGLV